MKIPRHPTLLKRQIDSRIRKCVARGPVLAASLVEIAKHCGRAGCRCHSGHKHVGHYLTFKVAGKTKTVYVPQDLVEEVGTWIKEHKRLRKLVQEISRLAVERIQGHVRDKNRRRGRP